MKLYSASIRNYYGQLKAIKTHEGFVVDVPPKEVAWNADLPSSPHVKHYLQMRGKTLKKGFRIAQ